MAKCGCAVVMRYMLFAMLFTAFVLSALTATSCHFMSFITVSDEAFASSNAAKDTGVQDAGQVDASDFDDGEEESSVDDVEEEAAAMQAAAEDEDEEDSEEDEDMDEDDEDSEEDEDEDADTDADNGRSLRARTERILSDSLRLLQSQHQTGLYRYPNPENAGQCQTYPSTQTYDRAERSARAGAALAPLLCCVTILFLLFECMFCNVPGMKVLLSLVLLTATICQGLTYLMLASTSFCDVSTVKEFYVELRDAKPCTISQGGIYGAFAVLMYFLCLVVMVVSPKPEPMFCSRSRGKEGDLSNAAWKDEDGKAWTDPTAGSMT